MSVVNQELCYETLFIKFDITNTPCIAFFISKALGALILVGSVLLKVPQIINIYGTRDVEGLNPMSFYTEVPLVITNVVYNYLQGNPFSSYGENVFILVQNLILVFMLWIYMKKDVKPSALQMVGVLAFFGLVTVGSLQLPPSLWSLLPLSNLPLLLISRIPQIIQNFRQKSTGQLAGITTFLTFAGSLARMFTTIQEIGWDFSLLIGFFLGFATSGILLLQIIMYGNKKILKKKL
mmetsp:Transcript_2946/g.3085  ORF Transcript_2946/g.3085 Transcript_2946/m.3085 type:complete len:236 (+) Transcript_2946:104-811(+)